MKNLILPVIVMAQFCCTSLWFAGNGVMSDLMVTFQLTESALGDLTSSVQFGFIIGTLVFAILAIADRFSPSKVFFTCALLSALFNLTILWDGHQLGSILALRFITGFFLAGIYPVGMKIAADNFGKGLGKSLGFLVGALVLGTAFPHLAKELIGTFPWKLVLIITSMLSVLGGVMMLVFVPDGPFRKSAQSSNIWACFSAFKNKGFRAAAFGYFGHMWELYAFWAFVPIIIKTYTQQHTQIFFNISLLSFFVIAIGGLACVTSGYLSEIFGVKNIARLALGLSGLCCIVSPLVFMTDSASFFIGFLLFWGVVVIADSPLFSTLVAQNVVAETKGSALTIVNSIGFAITIISIQLLNYLQLSMNPIYMYMVLALGPILGLIALREKGVG